MKEKNVLGDVKMFSVQVKKKLYRHATKLVQLSALLRWVSLNKTILLEWKKIFFFLCQTASKMLYKGTKTASLTKSQSTFGLLRCTKLENTLKFDLTKLNNCSYISVGVQVTWNTRQGKLSVWYVYCEQIGKLFAPYSKPYEHEVSSSCSHFCTEHTNRLSETCKVLSPSFRNVQGLINVIGRLLQMQADQRDRQTHFVCPFSIRSVLCSVSFFFFYK